MNDIIKSNDKKYDPRKLITFIAILVVSLLPFAYMYINKAIEPFESSFIIRIRLYDILMFMFAIFLFSYRKILNSMNADILYKEDPPSLSVLLATMYSLISFSVCIVIVKEEIIYLTNYFPNLKNFKFIETINYFDFYDKLFWENVSFVNNLTLLSSFLKVWIVGFLLMFNPFFLKKHFWDIEINIRNMAILFTLIILLSVYDSLNVDTVNLMKANYYFFKQSLIFLIIFLVLSNIQSLQHDKNYEKVIFNSEVILLYIMLISLQTIFYHYVYNVYFLEVVLIILAIASRDKFNFKMNRYFLFMLLSLFIYESIFLTIYSSLIDSNLLEKIIAMSISISLYFYKDKIIDNYKKRYPKLSEDEFKLNLIKRPFEMKFGKIFDVSKIETIISDGFRYKVNNEIVFELKYPFNIKNSYFFNFKIIYNEDKKYIDWFLGKLKENFMLGTSVDLYIDGKIVNTKGQRLYTIGFKRAGYIEILHSYNQAWNNEIKNDK